jgi:ComF family protein
MDRAVRRAKSLHDYAEMFRMSFSWLVPGQSLLSFQALIGAGCLSAEEFGQLVFLHGPECDQCGLPFEHPEDEGMICGGCVARPPVWRRARSALLYNDASSRLVLSLKRQGQRTGLSLVGRYMQERADDMLETADLLLPVPLHYRRLVSRGYNQSGWLATALGQEAGVPVAHDLLKRIKASPSQGHLNSRQRRENVRGAFVLTDRGARNIAGKRVVLIDDVYTTGATLEACARAVAKGRPENIDIVTLARVVAPKNPLI